mmetsp:Transcript_14046/g.40971  ORF Transcript_14046/g.40971 Transcript_14046/m.40971 type:complete len:227 (-) Transcript_14046:12-692(-)
MPRISFAERSASSCFFVLRLIFTMVSKTSASPNFSLTSLKMATACLAIFRASCFFCMARRMPAIVFNVAASATLLPTFVYIAMASSASCIAAENLHVRLFTFARVCSTEASALASVPLPSTCWAFSAICRASYSSPVCRWIFAMTCRAENFDLTSFFLHATSKATRADFIARSVSPAAAKSRASVAHAGPSLEVSSKTSAMAMEAVLARALAASLEMPGPLPEPIP